MAWTGGLAFTTQLIQGCGRGLIRGLSLHTLPGEQQTPSLAHCIRHARSCRPIPIQQTQGRLVVWMLHGHFIFQSSTWCPLLRPSPHRKGPGTTFSVQIVLPGLMAIFVPSLVQLLVFLVLLVPSPAQHRLLPARPAQQGLTPTQPEQLSALHVQMAPLLQVQGLLPVSPVPTVGQQAITRQPSMSLPLKRNHSGDSRVCV